MSNSHVTSSHQGACQDSQRQGDFSPAVMYLVFERVSEKMPDILWPISPPSFSGQNKHSHFPAWYFPLQLLLPSSRPPNSNKALQQVGFILQLIPGCDEPTIPGDVLWCLHLIDQLPSSLSSKIEKAGKCWPCCQCAFGLLSSCFGLAIWMCVCAGFCAYSCLRLAYTRDSHLLLLLQVSAKGKSCVRSTDAPG